MGRRSEEQKVKIKKAFTSSRSAAFLVLVESSNDDKTLSLVISIKFMKKARIVDLTLEEALFKGSFFESTGFRDDI